MHAYTHPQWLADQNVNTVEIFKMSLSPTLPSTFGLNTCPTRRLSPNLSTKDITTTMHDLSALIDTDYVLKDTKTYRQTLRSFE